MKMYKLFLAAFAAAVCNRCAQAQGTFQNLDFEQATIVQAPGSSANVYAADALLGWSALSGTNSLDIIRYNDFATIPVVGLYGSNYALAGNFSAWIFGYGSISQTGSVPADAHSLTFAALPGRLPLVTLGGETLDCVTLSNAPLYSIYGADISSFAGQGTVLSFSLAPDGGTLLDDIQFSPNVVPEPKSLPLASAAALLAIASWRRRRRLRP